MKIPFTNLEIKSSAKKSLNSNTVVSVSNEGDSNLRRFLERLGLSSYSFSNNSEEFAREGYAKNIDVFSVIRLISENASSIPWKVYETQKDGSKVELMDTPLHQLMTTTNKVKGYDWGAFQYDSIAWMLISGNCYQYLQKPVGFNEIDSMDILPSSQVTIYLDGLSNFFDPRKTFQLSLDRAYSFTDEEIIHTKMFNPTEYGIQEMQYGLSPLAAAIMTIVTGNERWEANAHVLKNKGQIGILTNRSEYPLNPAEQKKMNEQGLENLGGADKFGRVYWSNKDLDFIQLAMSTTDLQLLDTDPATLRAICNAFGVDSSLLNDPQNKTFNNRSEAQKAFYENAVIPLNRKFERRYKMELLPLIFPGKTNISFEPCYDHIAALQKDKKTEAERVTKLIEKGVLTPEQGAVELDYEFEGTTNDVVKILNSMPKELRAAFVEVLSPQQKAEILGMTYQEPTQPTQEQNED